MTRLGLSDSMRSTVSLENTEPLRTATRQRACLQYDEPVVAVSKTFLDKNSRPKSSSFLFSFTKTLGVALVFVVFIMGNEVFFYFLRAWWNSVSQVELHFDQLEKSIALLGRDTVKLKATADRFLQHCQETQLVGFTMSDILQNAVSIKLDEIAKTQMEEQALVMREMLQFYAQQKQKIQETKGRLLSMNMSLPVQITLAPMSKVWQDKEQKVGDEGELRERDVAHLSGELNGLAYFSEKTRKQDRNSYHQNSVERLSSQTNVVFVRSNRVEQSTMYRSIFYTFVLGVSAVYLWNAVTNTKKKFRGDSWLWSPIPEALSQFKQLLISFVVIEDLKIPRSDDGPSLERRVTH